MTVPRGCMKWGPIVITLVIYICSFLYEKLCHFRISIHWSIMQRGLLLRVFTVYIQSFLQKFADKFSDAHFRCQLAVTLVQSLTEFRRRPTKSFSRKFCPWFRPNFDRISPPSNIIFGQDFGNLTLARFKQSFATILPIQLNWFHVISALFHDAKGMRAMSCKLDLFCEVCAQLNWGAQWRNHNKDFGGNIWITFSENTAHQQSKMGDFTQKILIFL